MLTPELRGDALASRRVAGQPTPVAGGLLERTDDLTLLAARLERTRDGEGGLVLVEASAGSGKTALLRELRTAANAAGVTVLAAVGGELEREFAFGLVRQLFEPVVLAAAPERRERLLAGAAALAGPVVGAAPSVAAPAADASFATLHGLYWLVAALAEEAPLLFVVDDAHWGDAPSLRFFDFLARRAPELPVLLAVGLRPGEPGAEHALLSTLAEAPGVDVVRPAPLSADGVRSIVAEQFGADPSDEVVAAALETTGGNPLFLRELMRTLVAGGTAATADAVRAAVPSSVTRSTERRLSRLPEAAQEVGRALAVLGGRGDAGLLAAVTGIDQEAVGQALAALREVELIEESPLRFVHPLLRQAVAESVAPGARDELHRRAAEVLRYRPGAEEDLVVHLLAAPPLGEAWAADALRTAGHRALAEGAPDAAVRRLRRALAEASGLDETERARLELEVGRAATSAGDPVAQRHLRNAARASDARIAAEAAATLVATSQSGSAADVSELTVQLRDAFDRLGKDDAQLRGLLAGQLLNSVVLDPRLAAQRRSTLAELAAEDAPGVLAHRTFEAACADVPAAEALGLAERTFAGRPFATLWAIENPTSFWAFVGLLGVDGAALGDAAIVDAEATVQRHHTRLGHAFVSFMRAEWALAFGSVARAEAGARDALEVWEGFASNATINSTRAALARALVARGAVAEADGVLAMLPTDEVFDVEWGGGSAWIARAQVRMAQGRHPEAIADLRRLSALLASYGWSQWPQGFGWADLARALVAVGEAEEARAIAEDDLARSRRRGVVSAEAEALVALGQALGGKPGLDALRAAAAVAEHSPAPLTRARAALELGAALRRSNHRADAREHLAAAREHAAAADATGLIARATEELTIAGGRPRRVARSGRDALTPSELRVAEHAAAGMTNREIAEQLFVTRKTVEFQLGAAYSKLGIRSRAQLAGALGEGTGTAGAAAS